jgi:hypothetical protein
MQTRSELADIWLLVSKHSKRLNVDIEKAFKNLMTFSMVVGYMENRGELVGKNPNSTAKGLYQFLDGSIGPAINRTVRYIGERPWMETLRVSRDANTLDWEQQTLLFLGDILGKRGTDTLMKQVMTTGSREAMKQVYLKYHHTAPDGPTLRRTEVIFNGNLDEDR